MAQPRSITSEDQEVAARLRWVRTASGKTRPELAQVLGVSKQQILNYELCRSRISAGQLVAIARAIGIPIGRLFGDETAALLGSSINENVQLLHDFNALDADSRKLVKKLMETLSRGSHGDKGMAAEKNS